ncbi:MAG TPA: hypothetical protein VK731_05715, partial [Candidatus Cybelea sp.]|nr:hypothetical protein [Candidatus Cybelea sp.]
MTWRRWSFEKAARKRVRAEVFASLPLREEYRLARAAARGRPSVPPWVYRLLFMGFLVMLAVVSKVITVQYVVAVMLLWTLGTTFYQASHFYTALYDDDGLIVFDYLPISDSDIFSLQWRRFLRGSWWPMVDFAVAYTVLLFHAGVGWQAVTDGLAFGVVQWVFIMAMAVGLVAFVRPGHFTTLALPFQLAALVLLAAGYSLSSVCTWLEGAAWCVPPLGWILQSLGVAESSGALRGLLPALMSSVVLALSPIAYQRVRRAFLLSEPRHTSDGRIPEVLEFGERLAKSPEEARAAIGRRQFLAGLDWQNAGLVERLFSRLLSARERTVAEFMLAANPGWTLRFRRMWPLLLLALGTPWLFRHGWLQNDEMLLPVWGLVSMTTIIRTAPGFGLPPGSGLRSPFYANYPIDFWELARVVLKMNIAVTSFVMFFFVVVYAASGGFHAAAIEGGLKWIAVAAIAQPLFVIAAISPRTNDA